mmetsp:Transcript_2542/g.7609  ORF Transcript_2542/g.7609 Transcript_2542/m.7609 type:complete len:239 (-) Transcript_2542:67-783(-)
MGFVGVSVGGRKEDGVRIRREVCRRRPARRERVIVRATGARDDESGNEEVQNALEHALRQNIAEMKKKGTYGEEEMDEIRKLGEQEIQSLAQALNEDLEKVRQAERLRAIDTEAVKRMNELLKKFDKQAEALEQTMEREQNAVVEEAEKIRVLSEELADIRSNRSKQSPKAAIFFFLSWGFGVGALFYAWRGFDSGYLADGLANAAVDAAAAALFTFFYLREQKSAQAPKADSSVDKT